MKITYVGTIKKIQKDDGSFDYLMPITLGKGFNVKIIELSLTSPEIIESANYTPVRYNDLSLRGGINYIYKLKMFKIEEPDSDDIVILKIKHEVLKQERELDKIKRQVEAYENLEQLPNARRERIPDSVKLFVWQRDEGKCTICGSQEKLEFDHIIPVVKGGSNTERNIQLLCERHNREKNQNII